jgi:hypothetical protein
MNPTPATSPVLGDEGAWEATMTYEQFIAKWTRKLGPFVLMAILNDLGRLEAAARKRKAPVLRTGAWLPHR